MKKRILLYAVAGLISFGGLTGCQGIFEPSSDQVLFSDDNTLDSPSDTMTSVIGIIKKLQVIADRTVLLGEVRGDLSQLTTKASTQLQELANYTAGTDNVYNDASDYYAVINNCNYFLANADTALKKRSVSTFIKEYAVVKAYRAWTYLQLAQIYGTVPFVTEPILSEKETLRDYPTMNAKQLSEYFIDDLIPYIETPFPGYGTVGSAYSQNFYIPIRLLLGDLCLWAERYAEAATYYHDYLVRRTSFPALSSYSSRWTSSTRLFESISLGYSSSFSSSSETVCFIPMETNEMNGLVSDLRNVFCSTSDNKYYNQVTYSTGYKELSQAQTNCKIFKYKVLVSGVETEKIDTLYAPKDKTELYDIDLLVGDLRLYDIYSEELINSTLVGSSGLYVYNYKYSSSTTNVRFYRQTLIYLRYAEALNRAGYPTAAFAVLKYGLTPTNMKYVSTEEKAKASGTTLLTWTEETAPQEYTVGIHAKGSGQADADSSYYIHVPHLATKADSTKFITEYVEDKIMDEMALETAFEGYRTSDLIRVALRRNDNDYFAKRIAARKGKNNFDTSLYNLLSGNRENWYLPLE
jgi:starch-binding outer membrane protein, SusD/RagB family